MIFLHHTEIPFLDQIIEPMSPVPHSFLHSMLFNNVFRSEMVRSEALSPTIRVATIAGSSCFDDGFVTCLSFMKHVARPWLTPP